MSIRDELKELVDQYHDAIQNTEYAKKNMSTKVALDKVFEEDDIRTQLFDKIDEVMDVNELHDLLKKEFPFLYKMFCLRVKTKTKKALKVLEKIWKKNLN